MNTSNDVPCILPNGKMPVLSMAIHDDYFQLNCEYFGAWLEN